MPVETTAHGVKTAELAADERDAKIRRGDEILTSADASAEDFPELVALMIELTERRKLADIGIDDRLGVTTFVPVEDPNVTIKLHYKSEYVGTRPGGDASIEVIQTLPSIGEVTQKITYGTDSNNSENPYADYTGPLLTQTIIPHQLEDIGYFGDYIKVPKAPTTFVSRPLNSKDRQTVGGVFDVVKKLKSLEERVSTGSERPTAKMIGDTLEGILVRK